MIINKDIIIFGGGIAGLWLLNRLQSSGYSAILLEQHALGQGQSVASQGMIHGGMKYALGGALTGASEAISDMPGLWRQCLQGAGPVNLQATELLSDTYYMWPRESLRSRFNAFLGSKTVRAKVDRVSDGQMPEFFRSHIKGPLYRLQDIVLNVPSLLQNLRDNCREHIYQVDWNKSLIEQHAIDGNIAAIHLDDGRQLQAQAYISTSGEGSEWFINKLAPERVAMQKRPLQMVIVKHRISAPVYVHCVAEQLSATPQLTITTHHCQDGKVAWYLGGELAEAGAARNQQEQLHKGRTLLNELFPWCDFSTAEFSSFYINRAEARQADGKRPDTPSILQQGNMYYCWPTKLTLAPALADSVLQQLSTQALTAGQSDNSAVSGLSLPDIATAPWDQ